MKVPLAKACVVWKGMFIKRQLSVVSQVPKLGDLRLYTCMYIHTVLALTMLKVYNTENL